VGFAIELSDVVVETYLPAYNLRSFFAHQIRWARGVRDARAGGYFGLAFTFGIPWELLAMAASGASLWSWVRWLLRYFFVTPVALVVVGKSCVTAKF